MIGGDSISNAVPLFFFIESLRISGYFANIVPS